MTTRVSCKFGTQELTIETGRMAKQSDGAVVVQYGGTVVLTTVVASKEVNEGQDFFPSPWIIGRKRMPRVRFQVVSSNGKDVPRRKKFLLRDSLIDPFDLFFPSTITTKFRSCRRFFQWTAKTIQIS